MCGFPLQTGQLARLFTEKKPPPRFKMLSLNAHNKMLLYKRKN
jgi:hypothetical protein